MNNEEKAKEIIQKFIPNYIYDTAMTYIMAKMALLQMAQWKDEQFSKFLLWLDDNYVIKSFTDGKPMTYAELIDNFESNSYERNTTKTDY